MFSERLYKLIGIHGKIAKFWGGVPFVWDPKKRKFLVTKSSWRSYRFQALFLASSSGYMALKVLHIKYYGSVTDIGFAMGLLLAGMFDLCSYLVLLLQPEFSAITITGFFDYWTSFCSACQIFFSLKQSILNENYSQGPGNQISTLSRIYFRSASISSFSQLFPSRFLDHSGFSCITFCSLTTRPTLLLCSPKSMRGSCPLYLDCYICDSC